MFAAFMQFNYVTSDSNEIILRGTKTFFCIKIPTVPSMIMMQIWSTYHLQGRNKVLNYQRHLFTD